MRQLLLQVQRDLGLVLMAGKAYAQKCVGVVDVRYTQLKSLIMPLCG
jgi:hypothetical protein